MRLVKAGYAVYGMDYEGHGKSEGLQGFVPSFDALVTDYSHHYSNICGKQKIFNLRYFDCFFLIRIYTYSWLVLSMENSMDL